MSASAISVYVLARNERRNIGSCLDSLREAGFTQVTVLDSGSTDGTDELIQRYPGVALEPFTYVSHYHSYNELTQKHAANEIVVIVDADMRTSRRLAKEMCDAFDSRPDLQAVLAPVQMYWEGRLLEHASLYPPKAFAFRGGAAYFEPVGHGERLREDVVSTQVSSMIVHDDRKALEIVLANQVRYASDFVARASAGSLSWRDKLRLRSPLLVILTPLYSYVLRRGFQDGIVGRIYAIDRLIAEALLYRASAVSRLGDR